MAADPVLIDLHRHLDAIDDADRRERAIEVIADRLEAEAIAGQHNDDVLEWECTTVAGPCFGDRVAALLTSATPVTWSGDTVETRIRRDWAALCRRWAQYRAATDCMRD